MRKTIVMVFVVVMVIGLVVSPATAAPGVAERGNGVDGTEYTRTECVYPTGMPGQRESGNPPVWHVRNFPYLGILTDGSGLVVGSNSGVVDIDLNLRTGSGSIRGTLAISDRMGAFEGRFSGHYQDGVWQGRGSAIGTGGDTGKLFKVVLQGLDPTECPVLQSPGGPLAAIDAASWDIVVIDPHA